MPGGRGALRASGGATSEEKSESRHLDFYGDYSL
jgi:hypothetical protein